MAGARLSTNYEWLPDSRSIFRDLRLQTESLPNIANTDFCIASLRLVATA